MSTIAAARLPPRSHDPEAIRKTMRFIKITRAAARFVAGDRALELTSNLNGCDDDLVTLESITESIERRCRRFGLELVTGTVAEMAEEIFNAWRGDNE